MNKESLLQSPVLASHQIAAVLTVVSVIRKKIHCLSIYFIIMTAVVRWLCVMMKTFYRYITLES